ncbi:MAG: hypothetical protein ACTSYD_04455 [Candidatus Heimdallarchaeaceae archaeon]
MQETEQKEKTIQRIVSLDFLRGLAIFLMVFVHSIYRSYDYGWIMQNPEAIKDIPWFMYPFLVIIGYFGMWISFFILLSAITNTYSMLKKAKRGQEVHTLLVRQVVTGLLIVLVGKIKQMIIGYDGYIGEVVRYGDWSNTYPFRRAWFESQALDVIGYSIVIISIINYLLIRFNILRHLKRSIIIYSVLAVISIVVTPYLMNYAQSLQWRYPDPTKIWEVNNNATFTGWPDIHVATANPSFRTFMLVILVGKFDPLLPYLFVAFVGAIIGLCLVQDELPQRFRFWGFTSSIIILIMGLTLIILNIWTDLPAHIFRKPPDVPIFLILAAGEIAAVFGMFSLVECKGKAQKFGQNKIVKIFRKWGMLSLTLFVLELFETLSKGLLTVLTWPLFHADFIKENTFSGIDGFYGTLLVAFFVLLCFYALVELWSRVNFFLSFEWLIVEIQGLITKQKSAKINVKKMMNDVIWINFK